MKSSFHIVGLWTVLGLGCRGEVEPESTEEEPGPVFPSTGVGNPGNMTARTNPVDGLAFLGGTWPLQEVEVELCSGQTLTQPVPSGAVRLDGEASVVLPLLAEVGGEVCRLVVRTDQPLDIRGRAPDLDAEFTLELDLFEVAVDLSSPLDTDERTLELQLGADHWLDPRWLGLVAGEHVTVRSDHPQHDVIVQGLSRVVLEDTAGNTELGASSVEPVEPSMHLAVGVGGWVVGSFDDGVNWTELRAPVDDSAESHLYAVAAADAGAPLAVAVGGETVGTVVFTEDGTTFETADAGTFGLRDVVWTGSAFMAAGFEGRVATSTDAQTWNVKEPLGDCHFESIARSADTFLLVGADDIGGGCVWASFDGGESFEVRASLPTHPRAVYAHDDSFIAVGDNGKLSWTLDDGQNWSTVVLDDAYLHDVIVWDGWVKVLGDGAVHYTQDFFDISVGETAGFTRFTSNLTGDALLVLSEDGEVWAPPTSGGLELSSWDRPGSFGRSELGGSFSDVVVWHR